MLLVAFLAGCGGAAEGPPRIRYGRDTCAECRMIIADERFAAAAREDGRALKFDDIGCLFAYRKSHPAAEAGWVRDSSSGRWIESAAAQFVVRKDLATPMVYGITAIKKGDHDEIRA